MNGPRYIGLARAIPLWHSSWAQFFQVKKILISYGSSLMTMSQLNCKPCAYQDYKNSFLSFLIMQKAFLDLAVASRASVFIIICVVFDSLQEGRCLKYKSKKRIAINPNTAWIADLAPSLLPDWHRPDFHFSACFVSFRLSSHRNWKNSQQYQSLLLKADNYH